MLDNKLIESALQLTGKTMSDVKIYNPSMELEVSYQFSIEKFSYYLLSPEFIEKYSEIINGEYYFVGQEERTSSTVGRAIYEYQSGQEQPLIQLLKKITHKPMRRKSTIPELQELYTKWETKRNIIHERQYIDSKELKQVNSNLSNITYKIKKLKLSENN